MRQSGSALVVMCAAAMLAGCAVSPESIAPAYISEIGYSGWTAEQLAQEQTRLAAALSAACDAQRRCRSNDTMGVILLGLPVSSLSGSNQASEIARLKGELQALQKAAITKGYTLPEIEDPLVKKRRTKPSAVPQPLEASQQ